jgi:hypothetical protein
LLAGALQICTPAVWLLRACRSHIVVIARLLLWGGNDCEFLRMRDNECVPVVASGLVHQQSIAEGVARAARVLAPEVVRIRYSFEDDWSGNEAVFFRVVLKDSASKRAHLREVARRVAAIIAREVQPSNLGLQAYFNFRSESEQAQLKEEAWV